MCGQHPHQEIICGQVGHQVEVVEEVEVLELWSSQCAGLRGKTAKHQSLLLEERVGIFVRVLRLVGRILQQKEAVAVVAQPVRKEAQGVAVEPEVLLPTRILTAREMKKI